MQEKIAKKYQFYFSVILIFFLKRLHDTKHFNSKKKEKERSKKGKEKENID